MNIKILFAILSTFIGIIGTIPYVMDIFRGTTKPHMYSWLIWTILQVIGAISMFSLGAGFGMTSVMVGAFSCGFIFILSFKFGTKNIKIVDKICLLGAIAAIVVYFFLHDPFLSIIIITIIDLIGFLPTLRKSYEEPQTETVASYILSFISYCLLLFAISVFTFQNSLYAISLIITNAVCAFIIIFRRNKIKKHKIAL